MDMSDVSLQQRIPDRTYTVSQQCTTAHLCSPSFASHPATAEFALTPCCVSSAIVTGACQAIVCQRHRRELPYPTCIQ